VRVISGIAKGKKLKAPLRARPLTDRVREALYNILRQRVLGSSFLDLFAGSGAVGIEALSRGARQSHFVEINRQACSIIRENLQATGFADQAIILNLDASKGVNLLARQQLKFDIIFVGAPYDSFELEQVLLKIAQEEILVPGGILIAEHRKQHLLLEEYGSLKAFRQANYGETVLNFYSVGDK